MAMTFYYMSGSPFAWKVWLSLERKRLAYDFKLMSLDAGDLKRPEFAAINPRQKVPVLDDNGFIVTESTAIVEYLEDQYASSGEPLWPKDAKLRATARVRALETDNYLYPVVRTLALEILMKQGQAPDEAVVAKAKEDLVKELALIAPWFEGTFVSGDQPSVADFTLYPITAILGRIYKRQPNFGIGDVPSESMRHWMGRIEALPYFSKTIPPHWKA